ncbi:MAG TPA: sensor histidine kinase, partial [Acidimicrobiales bacterium]|nr:sensor histidine kinase [Acidimicrobiales bacterium]
MTGETLTAAAGFCHDAVFYGSDEEFLGIVAPFLDEGVAAGEPTLAALGDAHAELMRSQLAVPAGVTFLPGSVRYDRPAASIKADHELFARHVAAGADSIRVVVEMPEAGVDASWDGRARYEAAANRAFESFPLWGLCAYNLRTTPPDVVDDVERTHPFITTADGCRLQNDRYEDPATFLANRPRGEPDPLEGELPPLELVGPSPAVARHAVTEMSGRTNLSSGEVDDMIVAVSEVVTNAILHGRPPATVRVWAAPDRMVVTVHDLGPGPSDPFVGLVPTARAGGEGGFGLWIAHQLCRRVTLDADDDGFTVR